MTQKGMLVLEYHDRGYIQGLVLSEPAGRGCGKLVANEVGTAEDALRGAEREGRM